MLIKVYKHCFSAICLTIFLFWQVMSMLIPVEAISKSNTIELVCKTEEVTLSGIEWNLYKVGELNTNGIYILQNDFRNYPIELNDLSTSDMLITANTLENYAILDDITPNMSDITNKDGKVKFESLDKGLYLLSGESITVNDTKYIPSAMLIEILPDDNSLQAVDLVTYPKFIVKRVSYESEQYTVKKVWLNDEDEIDSRPQSILLELYKDGSLYDTITLDDSNDWSYSWISNPSVEWRVKEIKIPKFYTIRYLFNETQYLVMNSYNISFNSGGNGGDDTPNTDNDVTSNDDVTTIVSNGTGNDVTTIDSNDTGNNVTTIDSNDTGNNVTTIDSNGTGNDVTTIDSNDTGNDVTTIDSNDTGNDVTTINSNGIGNDVTTIISNDDNNDKLTQTGQLWWPVPVLASVGLILIVIGYSLHSKDK